jgi:hypothetical protein
MTPTGCSLTPWTAQRLARAQGRIDGGGAKPNGPRACCSPISASTGPCCKSNGPRSACCASSHRHRPMLQKPLDRAALGSRLSPQAPAHVAIGGLQTRGPCGGAKPNGPRACCSHVSTSTGLWCDRRSRRCAVHVVAQRHLPRPQKVRAKVNDRRTGARGSRQKGWATIR